MLCPGRGRFRGTQAQKEDTMRPIATLMPNLALRRRRHLRPGPLLGLIPALSSFLALALTPAGAAAATAPSLPTGAWSFTANGSAGTLEITALGSKGTLIGTALGVPIKGFWNGFA